MHNSVHYCIVHLKMKMVISVTCFFTTKIKNLIRECKVKHLWTAPGGATGIGLCELGWDSGFYPKQKGQSREMMCLKVHSCHGEGMDGLGRGGWGKQASPEGGLDPVRSS